MTKEHPIPKPREHKLAYRAVRSIRLDRETMIKAGDDLPLPRTPELIAAYDRLILDGAVQRLLDGLPYVETIKFHGARTRPTITRRPI